MLMSLLTGELRRAICALLLTCTAMASLAGTDDEREAGDALSYLLPAGVLAVEVWHGDREGATQFVLSFATTLGVTEVLKRTTHVERPDQSNDQSFPSGHAARAFAAATFVHRRHGLEPALPLYALATYVGYTRVQSQRHRWVDVAGAAAVSAVSTWVFVEPAPIVVSAGYRHAAIQWSVPLR
ncbi:MAG TPA: phosphatase PAP2 family protein [Rhizobacter sp.]|nr:phosphatase PAP2 family protein [Rhizobacter sp.]